MTEQRNVAFATGSRADYGIMRRYLGLLEADPEVNLEILVTGSLLEGCYGHQVKLIQADGFKLGTKVKLDINTSSNVAIAKSMSEALVKFSEWFDTHTYDLLIILGDRYEMLSIATAAAMQRVPILHIHGGEATYANYDEFIRHSITKMSLYHFTATEEYRRRVIQLGEAPDRVFNLGALGAENCLNVIESNVSESIRTCSSVEYFVVLFHPETISEADPREQIRELLKACEQFPGNEFVFIGSNADTHAEDIRTAVQAYVRTHSNARYYENLPTNDYHYLIKHSVCLIGNSSSGLIEAPSLGAYTINIGNRQDGRVRGESVLDVLCSANCISEAMRRVSSLEKPFRGSNPYYEPNAAKRYLEVTKYLLSRVSSDISRSKEFYDIQFNSILYT